MNELIFFCGTMNCGKSTLALQTDYMHSSRGRCGLLYTMQNRDGEAILSSRIGTSKPAREVTPQTDFWNEVTEALKTGAVDYLVCDEAQFYTEEQIDQLALIVDEMNIDVFAFGIIADFQTKLFPGSKRLLEIADIVNNLQLEALCWCGRKATVNARVVDGHLVTEGDQVAVGDVDGGKVGQASYEVICRRHFRRRMPKGNFS